MEQISGAIFQGVGLRSITVIVFTFVIIHQNVRLGQ